MGRKPYGKPPGFEGETLRRKLDRPMLSERPLSAATRWETAVYRSRGALRVVRVTKIRRREGRKGVRSPRDTAAAAPPWLTAGAEIPAVHEAAAAPPSRARCFSPYFLFSRAVGGRKDGRGLSLSLCRERLCPFFIFHSFEIPLARRRGAGAAADSRAGPSSAVREPYGRARASDLSFVMTPSEFWSDPCRFRPRTSDDMRAFVIHFAYIMLRIFLLRLNSLDTRENKGHGMYEQTKLQRGKFPSGQSLAIGVTRNHGRRSASRGWTTYSPLIYRA